MAATKNIVVGFDHSELGMRALEYALDLAAARPPTEVHVVRAIEPMIDPLVGVIPQTGEEIERVKAAIQTSIEHAIQRGGDLKVAAVVAHVAVGMPARTIADLAAQVDADMVVVGTHGRKGIKRALLGSVAEEVVRHAGCPVLAVREKDHPADARVPKVEPVCEDCAQTRYATKNQQLWCERHARHHPRAHVYSYEGRSYEEMRPWGFHM